MPFPDLQALQPYFDAGSDLIPLHRFDYIDHIGRERGKSPRDLNWDSQTYAPSEIQANVAAGQNTGVRLRHSELVIDVDPRNFPPGEDPFADLRFEVGLDLHECPEVLTGSGGQHFYFRKPENVAIRNSLPDFKGVEFKSKGQQVVTAGSIHPSKTSYCWSPGTSHLLSMPDVPESLLRLIRRPSIKSNTGEGSMTPGQLEKLLNQLDPVDYQDHDTWLKIMMASHHGTAGAGRHVFIEWSTRDPKYSDASWVNSSRWDSLDTSRDSQITYRTLYKIVTEAGGFIPHVDAASDFEVFDPTKANGDSLPESESLLERMNREHCIVSDQGTFKVFTKTRDPIMKRDYYVRSTKTCFENLHEHERVETPAGGTATTARYWLLHPDRRQYDGVIFDPEEEHEKFLNLWTGWPVTPKRGDWSLFRDMIWEVVCDRNESYFSYFLNWCAHLVQHPGTPAEVSIVLQGAKGTGKGTIGRALCQLAGRHGVHISDPAHLVGKFNAHMCNCIVLFADEAHWAGDKQGNNNLKRLITEKTLQIEKKYRDAEETKNMVHVIMAANEQWVVPAGLDGERRYAVFQLNNEARGDKARWKAMHRQLDAGGLSGFLFDMLLRPLGEWHPREDVPQTKALLEQKLRSLGRFESWWLDKLEVGNLPGIVGDWHAGCVYVFAQYLREDLEQSIGRGRYIPITPTQFGLDLQRFIQSLQKVRINALPFPGLNADTRKRASAYLIPSLADCRSEFESLLGGGIQWGETEEQECQPTTNPSIPIFHVQSGDDWLN